MHLTAMDENSVEFININIDEVQFLEVRYNLIMKFKFLTKVVNLGYLFTKISLLSAYLSLEQF